MRRPVEGSPRASRWIVGAALAVALVAFVAFLSLAQVASDGTGRRIMARTTATMTEIDRAMPQIQKSLEEAAGQSGIDPIPVADFPILVEVPREIVTSGNTQRIRDEILSQSAGSMYDNGVAAWADADPDASQNIGQNSAAGGIRAALSLIGETPRIIFLALTAIAGLAAAALSVALVLQTSAMQGLRAIGAAVAAAGAPAAGVVLLAQIITNAAGDDPFEDALADIAIDAAGVGLRNSLIVAVLGLTLLTLSAAGSALERREDGPDGLSTTSNE